MSVDVSIVDTRRCSAAGTSFAVASSPISILIKFTLDGSAGATVPPLEPDAWRLIQMKNRKMRIGSNPPPKPKNGKNIGIGKPPPPPTGTLPPEPPPNPLGNRLPPPTP